MKGADVCALCLILPACAAEGESPIPREDEIAQVEARLAKHRCIGSLGLWERNYRYGMSKGYFWPESDHANLDVIEFHVRRAGRVVISPGSARFGTENGGWPDSSSVESIDGSFVISSGRLNIAKCKPVRSKTG